MNYCETCEHRDMHGFCLNRKLDEDYGHTPAEKEDMLLYSYTEGGTFHVGPKFGCVHHEPKKDT